jgi:hypothetical protein
MPRLQVVMPDDEPDNAVQPRAEELRLLEAMLCATAVQVFVMWVSVRVS